MQSKLVPLSLLWLFRPQYEDEYFIQWGDLEWGCYAGTWSKRRTRGKGILRAQSVAAKGLALMALFQTIQGEDVCAKIGYPKGSSALGMGKTAQKEGVHGTHTQIQQKPLRNKGDS